MSKAKAKPATAKSPIKTVAPTKPLKKKVKEQQPHNRKERREAAWLRKTERKAAQQAFAEVVTKTSGAGLTYDQLSGPIAARSQPKPPVTPTFEQVLLEVVAEQAQQFELEAAGKVTSLGGELPYPEMTITTGGQTWRLVDYEEEEESLGTVALRNVVEAEVRRLLEKTGAIFTAHRSGSSATAQLAAGEVFEKELESPLGLRLAEVIIADDPAGTIEDFLEEVHDRIEELLIVSSSLDPESELEKSSRLGLIDEATVARLKKAAAEEAVRLNIAERLAELTSGAPMEIDAAVAVLIAEAAQAAEAEQRERAVFRKTLSQRLRQRKERGGRRTSKSSEEPGDEELVQFLISHRGDLATVQGWLPVHIREQVDSLLDDDERKKPLRRLIATVTDDANRLWVDLKFHLAAGAGDPETAVAQNAAAMKDLLGILAQIKNLHIRLTELDKPQPVAVGVLEELHRDKSYRGNSSVEEAWKQAKALAAQATA